ncbi:MAG: methyltransferase domain-containing protein [Planctomycetota bacterium]
MDVRVHTLFDDWSYKQINADRTGHQREYGRLICEGRESLGRVLDVGCGRQLHQSCAEVGRLATEYDGVEPLDHIDEHPVVQHKYRGTVEEVDLPPDHYDTAFSFYVVEHVADPVPFLESVWRTLRPGSVFWALTPHGTHPFALASNAVRLLNLKRRYTLRTRNDYASYYRLNTARSVIRSAEAAGFAEADIWRVPSTSWYSYVPKPARFLATTYDRCLGTRWPPAMLQFIFRLRKPH